MATGRINPIIKQGLVEISAITSPSPTDQLLPGAQGRSASLSVWRVLGVLSPLAIGGGWALSLNKLRLGQMNDLGLISVMPKLTLGCLGLLAISFALHLRRRDQLVLVAHLLVLIVCLYGITEFIEPLPRFSSVYKHVGIIQVLQLHSSIDPHIDAYFNWPGFFAFGDLLVKLTGWKSALSFAAWGPLLYNLLYLPPLLVIFSWATDDVRLKWLAAWFFFTANWVGQDYISPQGTAFLLWLAILALLLRYFTPSPRLIDAASNLRATLRDFGVRALQRRGTLLKAESGWREAGVLVLVLVLYGAIVAGHQLTPVPAILAILALTVFAGLNTRALPVLAILGLAAWIFFMATVYLEGNIQQLLGPLGSAGSNISTSVASRVGGSAQHEVIVKANIVFSAAIWALATLGFLRRLRQGRLELAYVLIGISPFVLPVVQPYGGEIFLRVFLFALPAAAFFAASLFFPGDRLGRRWLTTLALALVLCAVLFGFQYPRYGNERFANFTHADAAAVAALYRLAPTGSVLAPGADDLPWQYKDYDAYDYSPGMDALPNWTSAHPSATVLVAQTLRLLRKQKRNLYLIFTPSEEIYAESFEGVPDVLPKVVALLKHEPDARLLYNRYGAQIFVLKGR
jgi:hypothetical protein